jgi:hypothetical protein
VASCAICTMHNETRSACFLVWPVSQFGPQNRQLQFGDLGLKITETVSWFVPQNQVDDGLLVAPQNRRVVDDAGHALRSSVLLRLEASRDRVSQFASKLAVERPRVVHVASSQTSREDEVKDGWVDAMGRIGLFYIVYLQSSKDVKCI